MDYVYRLKKRIKEEGAYRALKYLSLVGFYYLKNLVGDSIVDFKYSGRLLFGNKKTRFRHIGANDVYHTDYAVMPLIFSQIAVRPEDVLVDVGCGKGRVINYWLSKKLKNKIYGLELDPNVACETASQYKNRSNVTIIYGDAIGNLPADGTVFYFYNPFSEEKVREFEEKLRHLTQSPITVVYYKPDSAHVFNNGFWQTRHINFERDMGIKRWGRLNKYHDLCIIEKSK